ncbi:MAG: biosynthetic-type acetolactate synthase large subunit [Oscillospiraceae bacterium]|jgi:acetolactate synthase-1/2/3 large subunit|nr:biosynthetic-type acetolactate synthase large subunit [Oscillospiraceae bacterium]
MQLRGSDIIVECLIEQGVDVLFGYPGGAVLNIYDSLYKYSDKIRHVLTSHEQHAGHAADGYARASGKTGVVLATSGPGATNLVTALATANMDSVPVVAITGNVSLDLLGLDSFQEVDITGITMPVTKHNFLVRDVNELADTIRRAFKIANSGRKGAVLIDVPKDITAAMGEYEPAGHDASTAPQIAEQCGHCSLHSALELINNSAKPLIYAGGGVISSGAEKELAAFAEKLNAPVSCSLMGQGAFDQYDSKYIGMLGMHGTAAAAETFKNCDLFIALGTRFSDRVTGCKKTFSADKKIIHIDIDEAEHAKNIPADIKITGDIKTVLAALNAQLAQCKNTGWLSGAQELYTSCKAVQTGTAELPVTPMAVLEKLDELTSGKAIITTEVGQNQMWAAMYYRNRETRTFVSSGGLGTMGFGLGAAIGAATGKPGKVVVNVAGDGSFGMNLNELVTLSKYKIPVIQLVLNNSVLGMVRQWQRIFYDARFSQTTLDRAIDYEKLAGAFGIKCYIIEKTEEIEPVLKAALELNEPVLIECRIDRDINVLPMVPPGADITKPITAIDN